MAWQLDRDTFWNVFTQQFGNLQPSATDGLNAVLDQIAQDESNWAHLNQIAYGLATFKWETANTFQPIYERGPVSYFSKYDPGTPIGNSLGNTQPGDGYLFRGRGYVQLTGRANYTSKGTLLAIDLAGNPDQALQADIAYKIASSGMSQGWFTGHRLNQYIPADGSAPDYVNARKIINGLDHADDIAAIAQQFQTILEASQSAGGATAAAAPVTP